MLVPSTVPVFSMLRLRTISSLENFVVAVRPPKDRTVSKASVVWVEVSKPPESLTVEDRILPFFSVT